MPSYCFQAALTLAIVAEKKPRMKEELLKGTRENEGDPGLRIRLGKQVKDKQSTKDPFISLCG